MWERYCRGVQAIVFVVDSSDVDSLDQVCLAVQNALSPPTLLFLNPKALAVPPGQAGMLCNFEHAKTFTTQARSELHELLSKPSLVGIPLLVLGNKNDLPTALSTNELIDRLELKVHMYM